MSCILCLKAEQCITSTAIDIFALNIQEILIRHFWVKPKEHDCICKECWNHLQDFHEFFSRIQQIHECKEKIFKTTPLENFKNQEDGEFSEPILDLFNELKEVDALEESPIDATVKVDGVSENALEESPIDAIVKDDVINEIALVGGSVDKNQMRITRHKKKNEDKSLAEVMKKRRGRPPKNLKSKPKKTFSFSDAENEKLRDVKNREIKTKKSYSRRDLSTYDSFISENFKLSCAICKKDCENFTILLSHFRDDHKVRGYVVCCGKKLLKRGVLVDHLYTHQNPEYFKCTICNKVLADRRCLELHQQTHQDRGEKTFKCEICSKAFHLPSVYRLHVERHTPKELRKYECEHCSKKYATKYSLNNHIRLVHLNKYSKVCDVCGKKFVGSHALHIHQNEHRGSEREVFNCNICGFNTKSKYELKRHEKVKHTDEYQTPQQCKYCTKISPNINALKRHVYYMHDLKKTHKCSMCEKSFKRANDLKEHFTTHTGDVLYICTFCPRTFNSNANMYAHRKKKHPKEWAEGRKNKAIEQSTEICLQKELTPVLESK